MYAFYSFIYRILLASEDVRVASGSSWHICGYSSWELAYEWIHLAPHFDGVSKQCCSCINVCFSIVCNCTYIWYIFYIFLDVEFAYFNCSDFKICYSSWTCIFSQNLVIQTRSVEFMPFYLSLSTFSMSMAFFLYGILNFDPFIYVSVLHPI